MMEIEVFQDMRRMGDSLPNLIRHGIINTFIDPDDPKEQERAYQRMYKNKERKEDPERLKEIKRRSQLKQHDKHIADPSWVAKQNKAAIVSYHKYEEKNTKKSRIRYLQNIEKELARFAKYRDNNREKIRKYGIEYYWKNRDEILRENKTEESKAKRREYAKKWRKANPDKVRRYQKTPHMIEYNRARSKTEKVRERQKKYQHTEKHRLWVNEYQRLWKKEHLIETRVRAHLVYALKAYANGKKHSSKAYGVDYQAIAIKLGKSPGDGYEVDHIIPVSLFNLNDPAQVKIAFSPDNFQWLPMVENIQKGGKNRPETVKKYAPILYQKLVEITGQPPASSIDDFINNIVQR
jgi:hypothetical protein